MRPSIVAMTYSHPWLFLFLIATSLSAQTAAFAPFDSWRQAVLSGNVNALRNLYSQRPPAKILLGKNQFVSISDEGQFWTSLKSSGLSDLDPKLLSIATEDGRAQLVIRVDARAGEKHIVASVAQLWIQQLDGWRLAISQRSNFGEERARTLPESKRPNPSLYPPVSAAQADLQASLASAAKSGKRVLVVFGANWCYDCHVLDTTFRSPSFAPLVNGNYVVVHINIGDEGKDNNDLARQFGVPVDLGVPQLVVLEPDGRLVIAQKGEFRTTTKIGPVDVRSFLEKWRPKRSGRT